MKKIYIVIVILFVILGVAVILRVSKRNNGNPAESGLNRTGIAATSELETQTNDEGGVSVAVTPKNLSEGIFEVGLNTHSVDLDIDLTKNSVIIDEKGKEYTAISWEGDGSGGHHRQGFLRFGPVLGANKTIELKMREIGGIKERSFKWLIHS